MGLLQNTNYHLQIPMNQSGGVGAGESVFLGLNDHSYFSPYIGQGGLLNKLSVPPGYTPGDAWFPALKSGGLVAGSETVLAVFASLASGRNAEAGASVVLASVGAMVGVASMGATAATTLAHSVVATATVTMGAASSSALASSASLASSLSTGATASSSLTGTADITLAPSPMGASSNASITSTAGAVGTASLTAAGGTTLTTSSEMRANAFAYASPLSTLTATATQGAQAFMVASAGGPEALSPQGLALAVWGALDSANNVSGTMGAKLNAAGTAGDPWTTAVPGAYPVGSAGWLLGQLSVSNPEIAIQLEEVWKRLGLDPANPLVSNAATISAGTLVLGVTASSTETVLSRQ